MAELKWRLTPDGMLELRPVVGWEGSVLAGSAVGVQLQFVKTDEQLMRGEFDFEQLVFAPDQAIELADMLKKLAEHASSPPSVGTTAN